MTSTCRLRKSGMARPACHSWKWATTALSSWRATYCMERVSQPKEHVQEAREGTGRVGISNRVQLSRWSDRAREGASVHVCMRWRPVWATDGKAQRSNDACERMMAHGRMSRRSPSRRRHIRGWDVRRWRERGSRQEGIAHARSECSRIGDRGRDGVRVDHAGMQTAWREEK